MNILRSRFYLCNRFSSRSLLNFSCVDVPAGSKISKKDEDKVLRIRGYCTLPKERTMPRLMEFPEILWPSVFKSIKNWIFINFVIRPYFDKDFQIKDFVYGTKRALNVISSKLVAGDFNGLNDLVSNEAIEEIKPIIQKLSISQRQQLEVLSSDVYLSFPYEVGIMFDEKNEEEQKRWVEITMVFHVLRGLTEMRQKGENVPWNMGTLPEYQDRVFVCNYRFIKEYTKGRESDWTANIVNHFKPIDMINEK